jgi:hypothetical protein
MPRPVTAAQAREPPISTDICFSALEGFAAAGDLEELAQQHVHWSSSSTSSWTDTLKALMDAYKHGTEHRFLLSAALFKPLGAALANALLLLAAEAPAALLSEVCAARWL